MKKLLSILGASTLTIALASYAVACNTKEKLEIIFVPSINSTEILKTVKPLGKKLREELKTRVEARGGVFDKNVEIKTSTSYEIAGDTLKQGKAAIALLPINTYASYRGEEDEEGRYKDIGWLLSASRSSVRPETTYTGFKEDGKFSDEKARQDLDAKGSLELAKHYNKEVISIDEGGKTKEEIDKTVLNDEVEVSYYRSYIYSNREFLKDEGFGLESIQDETIYKSKVKEMVTSKTFSFSKSTTSSAGMIYPLLWLRDVIGLTDDELHDVYSKKKDQGAYPDAAQKLGTGEHNFVVGFGDIRTQIKDNSSVNDTFKKTTIIGASDPIVNDGIQYSRKVFEGDSELVNDIRGAFETLVKKPENKDIFEIYQHTGYVGPKENSASKEFEIELDKIITSATTKSKEMLELIEDWV